MKRAFLAVLAMAGAAHAQESETDPQPTPTPDAAAAPAAEGNGRVIYNLDFFARFSPQNANDMVSRVPGFSINEGEERRGFSGSAGNVLIDGRRPSTKSQSLEAILSRIPASQVARVELIRDTADTADAAGQSMLVNIVRTPTAGAGIWEGSLEQTTNGRVSPRGEASWTGRVNALDYSVGVSRYLNFRPLDGGREFRDAAGGVIAQRIDLSPRTYREGAINAEMTTPLLGGAIRVNAQVDRWNFRAILDSFGQTPAGAPTDDFSLHINERRQSEEAGFNFDRSFGPVDLTLIGLATLRHYANDESTEAHDATGAFVSRVAQSRRNGTEERIIRGTLAWPLSPAHRIELGGELAYNSLDANLSLTRDVGAGPVPVPLPAANVLVEEQRSELFATFVWRAPQRWTLEATIAGEMSTLTQTGDTNLETELAYFKPSIQLARQFGARNQVRFRVYRDVGQLDFNDFVSAAGLADDIVFGGNPNLRPETSWRGEAAIDLRFGADAALGLRGFVHLLEDAGDVVPVGPPGMQFDAPGNIGDGWVRGVQATATIPLGFVLPGARLTLNATAQESEVTDPVTGQPRVISAFRETRVEANFRQDITSRRMAWGLYFYKEAENDTFRLNETDTYEEGPFLDLFVETTAIPGLRVRAFVNNLLDSPFRRQREFYAPDRTASLALVEERERNFGQFWGVSLSGSF